MSQPVLPPPSSVPLESLEPLSRTTTINVKRPEISDKFWGEDPAILFEKSRLAEFFPSADQTLPERMNSISRLVIYVSVVLSIYQSKTTAIHFGILLLGILYFIWKTSSVRKTDEKSVETFVPEVEACIAPTPQNPFMNFLPTDKPGRPPACKGSGVQETAANLLDEQLFSDVDDLFSKNANQRLFRTMPNTTGIPDREQFANLLFKDEAGCKTTGECIPWENLSRQRDLIPEDLEEDDANFLL